MIFSTHISIVRSTKRRSAFLGTVLTTLLSMLLLLPAKAQAKDESSKKLKLTYHQSIVIDSKPKFQGTTFGGFSGLSIKGNDFYVITDDRGRYGNPRIYKFKLSYSFSENKKINFKLKPVEVINLFKKNKKMGIFDFEALAFLDDGWLVSSEGDWNSRPRVTPSVFWIKNGDIKKRVALPNAFIPKFKGKQSSGLYNNKGFEGIYFDDKTRELYLLSESGLLQKEDGDSIFYLLEYKYDGNKFKLDLESQLSFYKNVGSNYLYNGATDLIKLSENRFLILTRSIQTALTLSYANTVWMVSRKYSGASWEVEDRFQVNGDESGQTAEIDAQNSAQKNTQTNIQINSITSDELNQNYEGMSILDIEGKKYLVMVSDNNFHSYEKTVFSFFELEVK